MDSLKISAICPTFRRPELLEEALQSFLMQDYAGEKELIILNDEKEQAIKFDHPQVKIVNFKERSPSLADKYNYAASLATGDMITPWDDDDIFLPNRMRVIAENTIGGMWYSDYMYTDRTDGELAVSKGRVHTNSAFSARMFIQFGAYQEKPHRAFDFGMMRKLRMTRDGIGVPRNDNAIPSFIYRKCSINVPHHSGLYNEDPKVQDEEFLQLTELTKTGDIQLSPHWDRDWIGMAGDALKRETVLLSDVDGSIKIQEGIEIGASTKPPEGD